MKVYVVKFDWSTPDDENVELFIYDSYDKAYAKFKSIIKDEMKPEISWVGDIDWKKGKPQDHYIFKNESLNSINSWQITDEWDYNRHSFIDILEMEIM